MVLSVTVRLCLLVAAIIFTSLFASIVAQVDDSEPEIEPIGNHSGGLVDKGSEHGKEDGDVGPGHGEEGGDVGTHHGDEGGDEGAHHSEEGGDVGPGHGEDGGDVGAHHGEEGGDEGEHHGEEGEDVGSGHGEEGGEASSGEADEDPNVGSIENDPAHIVSQALLCFSEKHIYSECEESYRLSETGELHVPFVHVHEFCNGPCLEETNLMLHCLDGIMEHFLFFNKATTRDVKDTILAACEHGGDLDVGEHMKGDGSIGSKVSIHALFRTGIAIIGLIFLL